MTNVQGTTVRPDHSYGVGDLSPRQELAILARSLFGEGYDDYQVGHISYRQPDDTLLVTPWELGWDEVRASDIARIDLAGGQLEGELSVSPAIELHLELHRRRHDIAVGVHHHPRYGTIWGATGRIPPAYDQRSSLLREDRIAFLDEYAGAVYDSEAARLNIEALAESDVAFLANHGVMVLGATIVLAHTRAISLEWRCRQAWHVEALGEGRPMPADKARELGDRIEARGGTSDLFAYMARRVIRTDSRVLE